MIYVLTYDHPHRKTEDLLWRLKMDDLDVMVVLLPWADRQNFKPLYDLKPKPLGYWPQGLCGKLGFPYANIDNLTLDGETILIAGAPILPKEIVDDNWIINAHCGWLPDVRGLDALKWAIYYDYPIGVTTHFVDAETDAGKLIERREVKINPFDSLHSLAMRQYELEIDMLIEAVGKKPIDWPEPFVNEPTRRMPHHKEVVMAERFERMKMEVNDE